METMLDDFTKGIFQFGDAEPNRRLKLFDGESDLSSPIRFEPDDAPDILRKSMERFLIGNVI